MLEKPNNAVIYEKGMKNMRIYVCQQLQIK